MDFLEAASKLMYSEIEIISVDALEKLFCERAEEIKKVSSLAQVEPFAVRSLHLPF